MSTDHKAPRYVVFSTQPYLLNIGGFFKWTAAMLQDSQYKYIGCSVALKMWYRKAFTVYTYLNNCLLPYGQKLLNNNYSLHELHFHIFSNYHSSKWRNVLKRPLYFVLIAYLIRFVRRRENTLGSAIQYLCTGLCLEGNQFTDKQKAARRPPRISLLVVRASRFVFLSTKRASVSGASQTPV
jgi:hypothetical protein